MKTAFRLLLAATIFFGISSCKKGEDDPKLSLRSRKARMEGIWTMTRGNVGLTMYNANQPPYNYNFELLGSDGSMTESGSYNIYTVKYNLSLNIYKDGKISMTENFNGKTLKCSGTWDFSSGVGEKKKKADVFLKFTEISSGNTQDHLFNNLSTEISYHIKRLTNDELVLYTNAKLYMALGGEKDVFQAEYTFKKQ
jgi:hypothetical protein